MWQFTKGRSTFSVSKLNGTTSSSPGCSSNFVKSIDFLRILGGVPVFNLPVVNPNLWRLSVSPKAAASPTRPQGASYSPIKIRPPKKVPVVKTTERTGIILPLSVTTPVTFWRIPLFAASVWPAFLTSPGIFPFSTALSKFGGSGLSEAVVKISITVSIKVFKFGVDSQIFLAIWE